MAAPMEQAMETNIAVSERDAVLERHRQEKKDLIAKVQALKHATPKGNKKRKKEVNIEVAKLEEEQKLKHEQELNELGPAQDANDKSEEVKTTSTEAVEVAEVNHISIPDEEPQTNHSTKPHKLSKAQKRRNKKESEAVERQKRVDEGESDSANSQRTVETQKLKEKLVAFNLRIKDVPSDGNCLYSAVDDQWKLSRGETSFINVQYLRMKTGDYMLNHPDTFLPFLTKPGTGEQYTAAEFAEYCKEIQTTSCWGGHTEVLALSHVLRCPIKIIQADTPLILVGDEFGCPPLTITYHRHMYGLGEHFNSVEPSDCNDDAVS